jgi:hypothetical protein
LRSHTQRSHVQSCKRFAAWLKRSPDTATADEVRRFQLHLIESGASICNRNRIMTGLRCTSMSHLEVRTDGVTPMAPPGPAAAADWLCNLPHTRHAKVRQSGGEQRCL